MFRRTVALVCLCLSGFLVFARAASAQAFGPAQGEGNVTVTYQNGRTRGQLNAAGDLIHPDSTDAHSLMWDVEFGLSDRLAVKASLPFMMVRFAGGPNPHPVGINDQPSDLDDGTYHGTFQDFHFGARFTLVQSRLLAVTPFVEAIVPSHHYESLGQSVVGRDLRVLIVGAAVGGFADALLTGLYFQTALSHAVVQEVLGIRPNRSSVDAEVGYFVTPRFAIRFVETFQITHDGVDFIGARPSLAVHSGGPITRSHFLNHDRLLRSNVLDLGGGFAFALTDSLVVFTTAAKTAWGENVQRHRAVTIGASWHFRTRRGAVRPSPQQIPRAALLR